MNAAAQEQRLCSAHCEIIHRAVYSKRANVSAREEERLDDERVGRDRNARAIDIDDSLVVQLGKRRIAECGKENVADKLGAELAPAAVAQEHAIARGEGSWAAKLCEFCCIRHRYLDGRAARRSPSPLRLRSSPRGLDVVCRR